MRILVGLSGGVDSAVSARLLKQQGHAVTAGFMVNYAEPDNPRCTTRQDYKAAQDVASFLGIDFCSFDFRDAYEAKIISYIYESYAHGITPNPDIFCNNLIKFGLFLDEALAKGFDAVAMGHYARILHPSSLGPRPYSLFRGIDHEKDQSYFLARLSQQQLAHAVFPLGDLKKHEVRTIAHDIGLPNADRKDSQGLCFVGNVRMREFLAKRIPAQKGNILLETGEKVGEHKGAFAYTIGQKKGLGLNFNAYVTKIDVKTNTITVTANKDDAVLLTKKVLLDDWHEMNPNDTFSAQKTVDCTVKLRYRQEPQEAEFFRNDGNYSLVLKKPQRGIPCGQTAVVYRGEEVLGCGIITETV